MQMSAAQLFAPVLILTVSAMIAGQPAGPSSVPGASAPTPPPAGAKPEGKPSEKAPEQKADKPAEREPSAKGSMFDGEASEVAAGFNFTEGPCYVSSGKTVGYFVFSDIPNAKIHKVKLDEKGKGTPELLRDNSGRTNGNIIDLQGRLISAESEGRITRTDILNNPEAKVETLASEFEGKHFNSPNDLCVGAAGDVYFTDPAYFIDKADRKLDFEGVFRIVPGDAGKPEAPRKVELVSREYKRPNGCCLSPDGKKLYVADAGTGELFVHEVKADGSTGPRALFADTKGARGRGGVDGLRTDKAGNVYTTGPGGIWAFSPKGEWLDRLAVPMVSNFAFGGPDGKTLLLTSGAKVMTAKAKNPG
jgi:gluconolactonase